MSVSTGRWTEFDQRYGITAFDDKLTATMKVTNYYNSLVGKTEKTKADNDNITRARVALMLLKDRNFSSSGRNTTFPISSANQDGTFDAKRLTRDKLYVAAIAFIKNAKYGAAQSALTDLAAKGYEKAYNLLGYLCENGFDGRVDRERAREFYSKGGQEGHFLLENYESRQSELRKEAGARYGAQVEEIKQAGRETDDGELENLLSKMGQDDEFNFRTKAEFYRNAGNNDQYEFYLRELSKRGDEEATVALADLYIEMKTKVSLSKAEDVAKLLRKKGNSYADFVQGSCYVSERSMNCNRDKALKCFKRYLAANSDKKTSEKYLIAANYSAWIIFNNHKAGVGSLQEALRYATDVKKAKPTDAGAARLINDLNIRLIHEKGVRRKKLIGAAGFIAVICAIVMFLKPHMGGAGAGDGSGAGVTLPTTITQNMSSDVQRLTVNVDAANIRSGPGTANGVIASGKRGESFAVTGNEEKTSGGGIWYEIYLDEAKTSTGWVSSKVVE